MRKSNMKFAAGLAVMTLAAACMVTGCAKKDNDQSKNQNLTPAAEATVTPEGSTDTTTTPEGTTDQAAPYECQSLGLKIDFGQYASLIDTVEGTDAVQNDTFQAKERVLNLSAEINGTTYNCAAIHVFDRAFDENELSQMDESMAYLGQAGTTTYTISYVEECEEQDDEDVKNQWNDLMNNCISKLKDTIELTGLPQ